MRSIPVTAEARRPARRRCANSGAVRSSWTAKACSRDGAARRARCASAEGLEIQTGFTAMGGEDSGEGAISDDQLDAVPGQTGVVRVLDGAVIAAAGTVASRHRND